MPKDQKAQEPEKEGFSLPKASEPKLEPKVSASLREDFESCSVLSKHVKGLSDAKKIKFAAKYGIQYKDVSEIRGNAKLQYLN
tara:strand:+ start:129 stop:377 length:249 start_codon:yes stop_codon:yes gene_type:complete